MRSLLTLVGLIVVVFLGLGWYLGWYTIGKNGDNFKIEVNQGKVKNDTNRIINNVQENGFGGIFDGVTPPQQPQAFPQLPQQPQAFPQGFPQQPPQVPQAQPQGSPAFYIDNNGNMVFKPANVFGGNNNNQPIIPPNVTNGLQQIFGGSGGGSTLPAPR